MARFDDDPAARTLGEALAALRRAGGRSQAEAAARLGMTSQGWGLYESGRRPGLFRPDVQRRLTAALDATPEDLALQAARIAVPPPDAPEPAGPGLQSGGRAYDSGTAVEPRARLQLSNDDLAPWAASGVVIEYEPGRWPRRDQGCVLELTNGDILVRLYERADADTLYVRRRVGSGPEDAVSRKDLRRVGAVTARLEP